MAASAQLRKRNLINHNALTGPALAYSHGLAPETILLMKKTNFMALVLIALAIACLTRVLYRKTPYQASRQPLILTSAVVNQPLPPAELVNIFGTRLDDHRLRHGKVVLVFTLTSCIPCDQENEFLKTVINDRKDVSFFYVIPMGMKADVLRDAQSKYAFETFFDEGSMLAKKLEVYQVPLKVFLLDGVIKKTWVEATVNAQRRADFKAWLSNV